MYLWNVEPVCIDLLGLLFKYCVVIVVFQNIMYVLQMYCPVYNVFVFDVVGMVPDMGQRWRKVTWSCLR